VALPLTAKKPLICSKSFLCDSHRLHHLDLLALLSLNHRQICTPRMNHRRISRPQPRLPLDLLAPSLIVIGSTLPENVTTRSALPDPLSSELLRPTLLDTAARFQAIDLVETRRSTSTPPHSSAPKSLPLGGYARASSWVGSHEIVADNSTTTSSPSDYDVLTSDYDDLMPELLIHVAVGVIFLLDMTKEEEERMLTMDDQSLHEFFKAQMVSLQ
jgi:hypothetical protein